MGRKSISDIRKPEILEHVYEVLKTEGIQGTTLSKIADRMGVNSSLLVHYFKSKDNLMAEFVDSLAERYSSYFESNSKEIRKIKDPITRLDAMLDLIFDPDWDGAADASVFWACFYLSFKNDKIKERFRRIYIGLLRGVTEEIREQYLKTHSNVDDSEKAAMAIISLIDGHAFYCSATGKDRPDREDRKFLKGVAKKMLGINTD